MPVCTKPGIFWLLGACLFIAACQEQEPAPSDTPSAGPPNILMIAIDDLNDWIGPMGGHVNAITPSLDRLAAQGMLFTNAHANAAICGPSRASIMTGLLPSTTGIYGQIGDEQIRNASPVTANVVFLPEYFGQNGYKTMGIGKLFHGGAPEGAFEQYGGRIKGFGPHPDDEFAWDSDDTNTDWGVFPERDEEMIDYKTAQWAIERLAESHDRPFFLAAGFIRPHAPWYAPQKWFDMHPADAVELPPYLENDLDDVPRISRELHEMPMMPTAEWAIESGEWPRIVQAYLASISFVDHYVGEVLKALEESAYAENTIVVLWSDHGYHLGEKNRFAKHSLWEETSRVPLMIRVPGGAQGQVSGAAVSLLDLYPTLLELAGLPANPGNEGTSLVPIIAGDDEGSGHYALTAYGYANHAVRDARYRYIRYVDGSEELYDHQADPNEWTNLANDPAYAEIKSRLARQLPETSAPLSPMTNRKAVNAHFAQMYRKAGIDPKMK